MSKTRLVLFTVLLTALVITLYFWWNSDTGEEYLAQQEYDKDIQSQYYWVNEEAEKDSEDYTGIDFNNLLKRNSDVAGWIKIENTPIDYPIMLCNDNSYYLDRNLDKDYSVSGSLFLDSEFNTDEYKEDTLTNNPFRRSTVSIVYGHNMGSWTDVMFTSLKNYEDEEYYNKHSKLNIYIPIDVGVSEVNLSSYKFTYDIISVQKVKADDDIYKLREFASSDEEEEWYNEQIKKSLHKCPLECRLDSKYLILSTCANDGNDDNRIILICRRDLLT